MRNVFRKKYWYFLSNGILGSWVLVVLEMKAVDLNRFRTKVSQYLFSFVVSATKNLLIFLFFAKSDRFFHFLLSLSPFLSFSFFIASIRFDERERKASPIRDRFNIPSGVVDKSENNCRLWLRWRVQTRKGLPGGWEWRPTVRGTPQTRGAVKRHCRGSLDLIQPGSKKNTLWVEIKKKVEE